MKLDDIVREFLSGRHTEGTYNVYGFCPTFAMDDTVYVKGSYIINDKEAIKSRYKKITANKMVMLLYQVTVGDEDGKQKFSVESKRCEA